MRLKDKVAIITGAADGIGKAVAVRFSQEGAKVVMADINTEKGTEAVRKICENGGEALFVTCDVGSSDAVKNVVEQTVLKYGRIDILHNNAGIDYSSTFTEMDEDSWNRVLNINLTSMFRTCRYAVPHMKKNGGGTIVNMSSMQAYLGFEGYTAYAAAKGAILSMTKQLAVELAPFHIRVNSVSPGTINTPMTIHFFENSSDPEAIHKENAMYALGRIGEPEEVADAVLFLASSESSFITGIDLKIDGGLVIKP